MDMMIQSDKEYSVTRYWRREFGKWATGEAQPGEEVEPAMRQLMVDASESMAQSLQEEMQAYLEKSGKQDSDFPEWTPEDEQSPVV